MKRGTPLQRRKPLQARTGLAPGIGLSRRAPLRPRSAKMAALYRNERVPHIFRCYTTLRTLNKPAGEDAAALMS